MKKSLLFLALVPFLLTGCEISISTNQSKIGDDLIFKRKIENTVEKNRINNKVLDSIENKLVSAKVNATVKVDMRRQICYYSLKW